MYPKDFLLVSDHLNVWDFATRDYLKHIFKDFHENAFGFYDEMRSTVEGSQWHREDNVWVHTNMTIHYFLTNFVADGKTPANSIIAGVLALLYHDVGKPEKETNEVREDGGTYHRYLNHETFSANTFKDVWCLGGLNSPEFKISASMMNFIRFVIQVHLPYQMAKSDIPNLKRTLEFFGDAAEIDNPIELFCQILKSDGMGRISDNHDVKEQNLDEWILNFKNTVVDFTHKTKPNKMMIMSGPSGSGKSSFIKDSGFDENTVVSFDECYKEFYSFKTGVENPDYSEAWRFCRDKGNRLECSTFIQKKVAKTIDRYSFVVIDATMLTKKSRRPMLGLAQSKNCTVYFIHFVQPFSVCLDRIKKRRLGGGHDVPYMSLRSQFYSDTIPLIGDVDHYIYNF